MIDYLKRFGRNISLWFEINGDLALWEKSLLDEEYTAEDRFGKYKFYIKITREFSLKNGFTYRIELPSLCIHDKILYKAILNAVIHLNESGPKYERLVDYLMSKKKWQSL